MSALPCAVCITRIGTEEMPDGRLFCRVCATKRPELGADDRGEGLTWLQLWEGFVNFLERLERQRRGMAR